MGRRRKTDDGASEGSAAKKVKADSAVGGTEVRWEWENDSHIWVAYSDELNAEVTAALNANKKDVVLDLPGDIQMKVILERMVQKNRKTGWERRLRMAVKGYRETDYHIWQWEDEHGNWNPYDATITLALEKGHQGGSTNVAIVACHRAYTVDLGSMQQVNDATKVKRKIDRVKSVATQPASVSTMGTKAAKPSSAVAAKPSTSKKAEADTTTSGAAAKGSTGKKGRGKSARAKQEEEEEEEAVAAKSTRTVRVKKGQAPVDPECVAKVGVASVYSEGTDIWDCMLNQTNLMNNNNKYYLIQLLKDDNKKSYSVWQRWGRVGKKGQSNLVPCGPDIDQAKHIFCQKFSDKTKNDWSMRHKFAKVAGKYDMLAMDYTGGDDEQGEEDDQVDGAENFSDPEKKKVPDSVLDQRLQALINLICDVKSMEEAVIEMKYDTRKAPLGKLTSDQIKAGYAALKKIEVCINAKDMGSRLVQACDEFYTRVPHDFGMSRPPVIRTKEEVKSKLQLLEALGDIEIAMKIIKHQTSRENPIDTHYKDLKCDLEPMDKSSDKYKLLGKYLQNTHASTHNQYRMEVLDIFEVDKHGETKNFKDCGNRMLLWHGSRLTNWVGILSQGLRIAPPEAPVTGYMFGKGVYFADMSSKSTNYCFASRSKNVGLVLLCEVALGKCKELLAADINADKLPKGMHSVVGQGRVAPDPASNHTMEDGTVVPLGKGKDTGVTNPHGYTLNYNEFIVYDTRQIRMKYLMKVQFNFK